MAEATLKRGNKSITLPLELESGEIGYAVDIGKPEADFHTAGRVDPRSNDRWSVLENISVFGNFTATSNPTAYKKARRLADFIKEGTNGQDTFLDTDISRLDDDILVVPAGEQDVAVSLEYQPGRKQWVNFELTLSRVNSIQGNANYTDLTPLDSGDGPIVLADDTRSVELSEGVTFEREVGRPNTKLRKSPDTYYNYYDQPRASFDAWSIDFQETTNPSDTLSKIQDMFRQQFGRDNMTLDFNGVFGLGAFDVMPQGSRAVRYVETVGEQGVTQFPRVNLRVVDNA